MPSRRPRAPAEAALLQRLVERLPDVVFRFRILPRPKYEYISPAVERMTGFKPQEFYDDPELAMKIVHEDDRQALIEVAYARERRPIRLRFVHRDARSVWVDVNSSPIKNRKGEVVGFEGVARDVTRQVEAEERAHEGATIVRAMMTAQRDPFFICDADGVAIDCNDALARLFGMTREEIIGTTPFDRWPKKVAEKRMRQIKRAVRTGREIRLDEQVRGRYYDVIVHPIPGMNGEITRVAMLGRDITRRRRAELRLRESEERYRILYQDNPSMYFTVDESGTVLSVNTYGAEQLGYEPEEIIGRPVLDVFHPEDRASVQKQLRDCIRKGDRPSTWELRKQRKDGKTMWVRETARATQTADGSVVVLIVCEDITSHKRLEEELQRAREEVEEKVEGTLERKNPYGLTFRQLTVLHLVVQGKSDKEIGMALGISPLTVNTHVSRALRKMGASSRTEAGVRALREGLID